MRSSAGTTAQFVITVAGPAPACAASEVAALWSRITVTGQAGAGCPSDLALAGTGAWSDATGGKPAYAYPVTATLNYT